MGVGTKDLISREARETSDPQTRPTTRSRNGVFKGGGRANSPFANIRRKKEWEFTKRGMKCIFFSLSGDWEGFFWVSAKGRRKRGLDIFCDAVGWKR